MEPGFGCGDLPTVADVDIATLPTLTVRQLIGMLADTEDRPRVLRRRTRIATGNRPRLRQVLTEQARVIDELRARHARITWAAR